MTHDIRPGLLVLQGNRLELLRDAVLQWLAQQPLGPLEEEVFLVQSNGAAEWLKMALATQRGICAATRVELPARFLWRTYRQVLGREAVPPQSALDKSVLTWRLMRLLPQWLHQPGFAPLSQYLQGHDAQRRLQLARKLADLYDQYQIYRGDWLDAWAEGREVLLDASAVPSPLAEDQRWQALLWRTVLAELSDAERASMRPQVQRAMLRALEGAGAGSAALPRRVVLFGASHLPGATVDALVALSKQVQILVALPNPCRYHWADIIEGRELLRKMPARRSTRNNIDLAAIGLEAMHAHAHPLLAAWGRQGRDFMRQLDAFDARAVAQDEPELPRAGLFDEAPGVTLLQQAQAAVRDLLPLHEHPHNPIATADRSVVFHIAHSAQREVEVLHDQLLQLLAQHGGTAPLRPRDIVVMVPDIAPFAPAIRAVFGQYPQGDPRFIPFDIADLPARATEPLLHALDWLLQLPDQRIRATDIGDLLDVPAIARRFGLQPEDRPRLTQWIAGAGVRWGLDTSQRAHLGLAACGEQNSWRFGLRRMLLGYTGAGETGFADIVPYEEIGGLDAALLGPLADLLDVLQAWWHTAIGTATPQQWAQHARSLLDALAQPQELRERQTRARIDDALSAWLGDCAAAGFDEPVPLNVLRAAWLDAVDDAPGGGRFLAGGVTFCTLMPLRSIPFEVVCLLGMNDGDYPRQSPRNDFDLMRQPGQYRPGDRARREDDRYLMLEALLSARRMLYISWAGRSPRDNTAQPPSVLVAQLRDYIAAGWHGEDDGDGDVLAQRTTLHPLQPFSRRYFERSMAENPALFTYAREWRPAHQGEAAPQALCADFEPLTEPLSLQQLARFLKNPVKAFFRVRLDVVFDELTAQDDDEVFALDGLSRHGVLSALLDDPQAAVRDGVEHTVARRLHQLQASGALPMRALGARVAQELRQDALPMLNHWDDLQRGYSVEEAKVPLAFAHADVQLDDWLDGLRANAQGRVWMRLTASRLLDSKEEPRADRLIDAWVRQLASSACGEAVEGWLIGTDAALQLPPLAQDAAAAHLRDLLSAWKDGMAAPLPVVARTALAALNKDNGATTYDGGFNTTGEVEEPCLARVFPDFDALRADGRFDTYKTTLFEPLRAWASAAEVHFHGQKTSPAEEDA
ncbi:MAG: exodeoxyribonuclease V subunit gamma [Burkholderiaceae bacterium]|nr:exodeoxyribonuclease V subunit gamma [Burkholderiaceae bacterium]